VWAGSVHLNFKDSGEFERQCRHAREMGFDGKTLIHPSQVAVANAVFAPSPDLVEESREVIDAHSRAVAEGANVVVVRGKLVENLHVENAQRVLSVRAAHAWELLRLAPLLPCFGAAPDAPSRTYRCMQRSGSSKRASSQRAPQLHERTAQVADEGKRESRKGCASGREDPAEMGE